jgi:hypothetical protein
MAAVGAQKRTVVDILYFLQCRENLDHLSDCQFLEKLLRRGRKFVILVIGRINSLSDDVIFLLTYNSCFFLYSIYYKFYFNFVGGFCVGDLFALLGRDQNPRPGGSC